MTLPKDTIWPLEPHTMAKHQILKLYLQAWFPILSSYQGKVVYIDGFCGPGRYKGGEPGSPLIVLDLAANHIKELRGETVFWFIDKDERRIAHLRSELQQLTFPANFKITTDHGSFDQKLEAVLNKIDSLGAQLAPTFIFIDPFGFAGVPYSLVKRALKKPRCEALITFMVDSINRWLDHPQANVRENIAQIFGTTEVFNIDRHSGNRINSLRALYQKKLQEVAKFVRFFEMRDRSGRVEYLLFFASNHPLGHVKIKEAMWAVDPRGEFRFSDATNPDQQVMFGGNDASLLWPILQQEFGGKEVNSDEILKFVEDRTPFLGKHMRSVLKEREDTRLPPDERIVVRNTKVDGKPRRKASFPSGALVIFPIAN
jgi:three-Cys-motif partner protein